MGQRLNLQAELEELLGSRNVYFQPPESLRMNYPCIRYTRSSGETTFADNKPYTFTKEYTLYYIDPDPDSEMVEKIAMHFPMSRLDRHYTADGLNHDVFTIFY